MRDIADGQLVSADGKRLGRVADVAGVIRADGTLVLSALALGPVALARRISSAADGVARSLGAVRLERVVPLEEVAEFGAALRLRSKAATYDLADGDEWARSVLRFIPGSGWSGRAPRPARGRLPPLDGGTRVWIADLIGSHVRAQTGESLGRLVEVRATREPPFRVTTILMGPAGWLDRLQARRVARLIGIRSEPHAISWRRVARVQKDGELVLR
jgi:hypothetical protein